MSRVFIVAGLGYGDEGKGTTVDYLARRHDATLVARYNGGPQAAHHVVLPDGRWHCFSQFGAASLVPGTRTVLSPGMLVEPCNVVVEERVLRDKGVVDAIPRTFIDGDCPVVSPLHKMLGQMLEIGRGSRRNGSVGMGVGQAVLDAERAEGLRVRHLLEPSRLRHRLELLREEKVGVARRLLEQHDGPGLRQAWEWFEPRVRVEAMLASYQGFTAHWESRVCPDTRAVLRASLERGETVVLEGAQGVLLDPRHGFQPHVTRTRTTFEGAEALLTGALPRGGHPVDVSRIGVIRAYGHRHGSGPFVTEDETLSTHLEESHNRENPWQGRFRVGWLDLVALRYALEVAGGVDGLVVTGLDRLAGLPRVRACVAYEFVGRATDDLDPWFEWERMPTGRVIVHAIKPLGEARPEAGRRTALLRQCRPVAFEEFAGWETPDRSQGGVVPRSAEALLDFLASARGLGVPVHLASTGPTWKDKVVRSPIRRQRLTPLDGATTPAETCVA